MCLLANRQKVRRKVLMCFKQLYGKLDALERSGSNETHLLAPVTTVYYWYLLVAREYRERTCYGEAI
jgi:hypothetical protein